MELQRIEGLRHWTNSACNPHQGRSETFQEKYEMNQPSVVVIDLKGGKETI
jgi:hypothetical protein